MFCKLPEVVNLTAILACDIGKMFPPMSPRVGNSEREISRICQPSLKGFWRTFLIFSENKYVHFL